MSDSFQLETVLNQLDLPVPRYCHSVLRYFDRQSTETATVSDLGEFVREQTRSARDEAAIAIHLHHSTLPKLADAGLLEYDPRSQTVRCRGPSPEEMD